MALAGRDVGYGRSPKTSDHAVALGPNANDEHLVAGTALGAGHATIIYVFRPQTVQM
jgi:hypothetical protein